MFSSSKKIHLNGLENGSDDQSIFITLKKKRKWDLLNVCVRFGNSIIDGVSSGSIKFSLSYWWIGLLSAHMTWKEMQKFFIFFLFKMLHRHSFRPLHWILYLITHKNPIKIQIIQKQKRAKIQTFSKPK